MAARVNARTLRAAPDTLRECLTVEDLLWESFKLTTLAVTPVPQSQVEQHGQIATGDVTGFPQKLLRNVLPPGCSYFVE